MPSISTVLVIIGLSACHPPPHAQGRQIWANDPAFGDAQYHTLARRRFSQESLSAIGELANLPTCPGDICGTLSGGGISPLLAKADECAQQKHAEKVIEAALDMTNGITSQETRNKMIDIATRYRGAERNTIPRYDFNPVEERNSVYCQEAPKYPQLAGIVQAQNPKNNPMVFFDPKVTTNSSSVIKGSQPNTIPFGQSGGSSGGSSRSSSGSGSGAGVSLGATNSLGPSGSPTENSNGTSGEGSQDTGLNNTTSGGSDYPTIGSSGSSGSTVSATTQTSASTDDTGDDNNTNSNTNMNSSGPTVSPTTQISCSTSNTGSDNNSDSNSAGSDYPTTGINSPINSTPINCGGGDTGGVELSNKNSSRTVFESSNYPTIGSDGGSNGPIVLTTTNSSSGDSNYPTNNSGEDTNSNGISGHTQDTGTSGNSASHLGEGRGGSNGSIVSSTNSSSESPPAGNRGSGEISYPTLSSINASSGLGLGGDNNTTVDDQGGASHGTSSSNSSGSSSGGSGGGSSGGSGGGSGDGSGGGSGGGSGSGSSGGSGGGSSGGSGGGAGDGSGGGAGGGSSGGSSGSSNTSVTLPFIDASGLGPCKDMRIEFGQGLPGREPKDRAYQPFDFQFHSHGPALNLHIIIEFMCDELVNKCGLKNEDKRFADCKSIKKTIGNVKDDGSKADLWNAQFGFTTTYASNPCQGGPGTGGHGDGIPKSSSTSSSSSSSSNSSGNSSGGSTNTDISTTTPPPDSSTTTTPPDSSATTNYPDSQSSNNGNSSGGGSDDGEEDDC